jgi:nucleoid DNA-binding protein
MLNLGSLSEYLEERLNLPRSVTGSIVIALREYIVLTLANTRRLTIRGLGSFNLEVGKRRRVKFLPSPEVYEYLDEVAKSTGKPTTNSHIKNRVYKILADKKTQPTVEEVDISAVATHEINRIRLSFLKYLQQEFPYGGDWRNPVTWDKFSNQEVMNAVKVYRSLASEREYLTLWSVWASLGNRVEIANQLRLNGYSLRAKWERAIDTIIFIMKHKDLHPSEFSVLIK